MNENKLYKSMHTAKELARLT